MSFIIAYRNLSLTRDITIQDANDATITPGSADIVRAIIKRIGDTPLLTVTSTSPTANGSTFTKGVANRLRIVPADLGFEPGSYTLEIDYYDAHDGSGLWKNVDRQCFYLEE